MIRKDDISMEHNYYLAHYGVKGMKWKKRRGRQERPSYRLKRPGIYTSEQLKEYKKIQEMRNDPKFRKIRELHDRGIYTSEQLQAYRLGQKIRKRIDEVMEKMRDVKVKHYSSGDNIVKQFKNFISRAFKLDGGGGEGGSSSF